MATRPSKTTTPETPREPTFNLADLERLVAEGVAKALAAREAEGPAGKSDQSTKNEIAAMKAFKKRGFGIIKPHIDTKTFNLWVKEGLKACVLVKANIRFRWPTSDYFIAASAVP
jgi:hypothetical protein